MKKNIFSRALRLSTFIFVITLALCLGKGAKPALLGQTIDGLSEATLRQYPFESLTESLKVFVYFFVISFFTSFLAYLFQTHSTKHKKIVFSIPFAFVLCLWFWQIVSYPALFEGNLLPTSLTPNLRNFAVWFKPLSPWENEIFVLFIGLIVYCLIRLIPLFKRNTIICLILTSLTLVSGFAFEYYLNKPEITGQKNIYFIVIDSLRSDRISDDRVVPHINELRQDSNTVTFQNHLVGLPRTFPSWAEMLTGKYAPQSGIRHMFPDFVARDDNPSTLIKDANAAGFSTMVISDFAGDIFPRFPFGFQKLMTPTVTLPFMIRMNIDQFFPLILPLITLPMSEPIFPALRENPTFADPFKLVRHAKSTLADTLAQKNLVTVFFSTAHFPYAAPFPYYLNFTNPDYRGSYFFQKNPVLVGTAQPIDDRDKEQIRGLYDGSLAAIDAALGDFFTYLRKNNLWDDSIVIVTADHGEDLLEPNRLHGHGEHLRGENVLKVPLLIKLPKSSPPQVKEINFLTRTIDLRKTLSKIATIPLAGSSEGIDLSPWFYSNELPSPSLVAYHETGIWFSQKDGGFYQQERLPYPGIASLLKYDVGYSGEVVLDYKYENMVVTAKHRGITFENYRLIYTPTLSGVTWELYNRHDDPENKNNLIESDPTMFAWMRDQFKKTVKHLEPQREFVDDFFLRQD